MIVTMMANVFRDPQRGPSALLALVAGAMILLLNSPFIGWQWDTGTPGVLLGLGCLTLGAAELLPRNDVGRILAGGLRIGGDLFVVAMVISVVMAILPQGREAVRC